MIQYITLDTISSLFTFCHGNPFGCKILSLIRAYGLETPFAGFWIQKDGTQMITAALAKLEDAAILYAQKEADWEEIEAFLPFVGVRIILYPAEIAAFCAFKKVSSGMVMQWDGMKNLIDFPVTFTQNPPLRDVYALLCTCDKDGFHPPAFEAFYVDMSHRIRHRCARGIGIFEKNNLYSYAGTVAETDNCAVLGAVATYPDKQKKGWGSLAVSVLTQQLSEEGKTVFLFRSQGENEHFYQRLGFSNFCQWEEAQITSF